MTEKTISGCITNATIKGQKKLQARKILKQQSNDRKKQQGRQATAP